MNDSQNLPGSALVADLSQHGPGVQTVVAYWLGVIPAFPVPYITCAGFCFPKMCELLIDNPQRTGERQRVPVPGGLHKDVTEEMLDKLKEKLPRLVVRFTEPPRKEEPSQNSQGIADLATQPRKGFVITIPSEKDVEAAIEAESHITRYVRGEWDEPAANYMFMQPCVDQDNPQRGGVYPQTLDKTGLDISSFRDIEDLLD